MTDFTAPILCVSILLSPADAPATLGVRYRMVLKASEVMAAIEVSKLYFEPHSAQKETAGDKKRKLSGGSVQDEDGRCLATRPTNSKTQ